MVAQRYEYVFYVLDLRQQEINIKLHLPWKRGVIAVVVVMGFTKVFHVE